MRRRSPSQPARVHVLGLFAATSMVLLTLSSTPANAAAPHQLPLQAAQPAKPTSAVPSSSGIPLGKVVATPASQKKVDLAGFAGRCTRDALL
jgi:hypothetical protein